LCTLAILIYSFTQWDKAHYVDEKCRLPHSTMSEFYAS
uniref:Chemokine (C-C motif) ligand 14 n=1 Tax=Haemonchus placei TaxID=6290 RepID=A0A0N4VWQ3_HAEPC